ncbi:LysE family translocator [Primorskyibacter sp. S187A]|uniref:LysE family translocator n=1 Tax=Primorskyibacter sp. S187A TaxID=3415130 RepID=UPI003C7DD5D6
MIDLWIFVPACFAINLAFGPNNLMAMTNSAQHGVGFAATAALGRLAAFAPMILISALGLGVILATSAMVFTIAKVIGAAYLIYLGVKLLRAPPPDLRATAAAHLRGAARREAFVALSNPKAILTFAAFLPQFVSQEAYWQGYAIVGGLFLVLEFAAILTYATVGRFAARGAKRRMGLVQKLSGGTMIVFGLGLLLARRPGAV